MTNSSKLRILWIGNMFFSMGLNHCLGYWLGLRRWEMLSLAAVFFVMAAISWWLERRKEMCSNLYIFLTTLLLILQGQFLLHADERLWLLIPATVIELLLSLGVSAFLIWRYRCAKHEKR